MRHDAATTSDDAANSPTRACTTHWSSARATRTSTTMHGTSLDAKSVGSCDTKRSAKGPNSQGSGGTGWPPRPRRHPRSGLPPSAPRRRPSPRRHRRSAPRRRAPQEGRRQEGTRTQDRGEAAHHQAHRRQEGTRTQDRGEARHRPSATTAKRTTTKKAVARKAPARKTRQEGTGQAHRRQAHDHQEGPRTQGPRRKTAAKKAPAKRTVAKRTTTKKPSHARHPHARPRAQERTGQARDRDAHHQEGRRQEGACQARTRTQDRGDEGTSADAPPGAPSASGTVTAEGPLSSGTAAPQPWCTVSRRLRRSRSGRGPTTRCAPARSPGREPRRRRARTDRA